MAWHVRTECLDHCYCVVGSNETVRREAHAEREAGTIGSGCSIRPPGMTKKMVEVVYASLLGARSYA